jgi:hypothetical protein
MASILGLFKKFKNGLNMGSIQSVDEMSVIPLIGEDHEDIADPTELKFERTTTYGSMQFDNTNRSRPAIVPSNYMVRGTGAQDHAMSSAGIIAGGKRQTFETACCIESSQGGYLGGKDNEYDILPINLRKEFFKNPSLRNRRSYDKLWPSIEKWLEGIGVRASQAHLRYFYDDPNIKQALEEFAAEFEPIPNQTGAIIMFNDFVVGLEIMPSRIHWEAYWKYLIRGCYGAELVRLKKLGIIKSSRLALPEIPSGTSPEDLTEMFSSYQRRLTENAIPLLGKIDVKDYKSVSSSAGLNMNLVTTTSGGGGDIIAKDQEPLYVSIVF